MKLVEDTGKVETIEGKILPITRKRPPRMSRKLNEEFFEYRSTETCPECGQSVVYCGTCKQSLPVDTREYCKRDNIPLEPLYIWRQEDIDRILHRPILACPKCFAISWWADEDYDFDTREDYFKGLYNWIQFDRELRGFS